VQLGSAVAKHLFDQVGSLGTVALRLFFAAAVLVAVWRPPIRLSRRVWTVVLSYGVILGAMNLCFYAALARLPLGIAVTIEFLGPLAVALAGSRRWLDAFWALLAAGVVLLAGTVGGTRLNWAGVAWAAAAGTAWAAYILGSKAAGQRLPGASGLVIAMCVAAVVVTAPGVAVGAPKMFRPSFLAAGAGIGLLSSVIPYWLELEALRRIPTSLFGVWMSVQPAVAALIGLAVLSQHLSPAEWTGICCVVAASAGAAGSTRAPDSPSGNVTPQVPD